MLAIVCALGSQGGKHAGGAHMRKQSDPFSLPWLDWPSAHVSSYTIHFIAFIWPKVTHIWRIALNWYLYWIHCRVSVFLPLPYHHGAPTNWHALRRSPRLARPS